MKTAAIVLIAFGLSACAPQMTGSNSRGGMIHMGLGSNKRSKAFQLAEQNCEKYGRVAVEKHHSELDNSFSYECVEK